MIFMGSFLGGDELSIPLMPTSVDNIHTTTMQGGWFDTLHVTKDTSYYMSEYFPPQEWDFNTIMYANFDGNTFAGNLLIALEKISHLLIKRRKEGSFEWTTIEVRNVDSVDDLMVVGSDPTAQIGANYEYAAIPSLNGIEATYSIARAMCECNKLVILDKDEIWVTYLTDGNLDYTRTYPINMLQTLYNKYPTSVRNTYQNYDVINVEGAWDPGEEECKFDESDNKRVAYQKAFIDFLTNDKPKILKNTDGRIWLCMVSGDISDSAEDIYNNRKISFQMTEIGNVDSNQDLFESGFNQTVTEEWW